VRIGQGIDVHPFSPNPARPLMLGGVRIADSGGLAGHSDADALAHAVADAVLGAAGLGDLGDHFPDSDPAWAGADSIELLRSAVAKAAGAGWRPVNADCTVVLEAPKLAPHRTAMAELLSDAIGAPVNVKATRPEAMGALGRGEGVLCVAVVLMDVL
jgi:2-C-methyl-D-erythritol 2,4-cyclodiphosphate synthase